MTEVGASAAADYEQGFYEIYVRGHLDQRWAVRLEGLAFRRESNGTTILIDQAALHGVLNGIRDLGIPIISVKRVGSSEKTLESNPHD